MPTARSRSSLAYGSGLVADIPDKLYFKIGEVACLVGVETHVLRYWEKEISAIRPSKSASNQRRYRRRDVEVFREIRRLLYEEKLTLAGVQKRFLAAHPAPVKAVPKVVAAPPAVSLEEISQAQEQARQEAQQVYEQRLQRLRQGLRELIRMTGDV